MTAGEFSALIQRKVMEEWIDLCRRSDDPGISVGSAFVYLFRINDFSFNEIMIRYGSDTSMAEIVLHHPYIFSLFPQALGMTPDDFRRMLEAA